MDYPKAKEEKDPGFSLAFNTVMDATILIDSDHEHDQKIRRSLTSYIALVGSTLLHGRVRNMYLLLPVPMLEKFLLCIRL